MAKKKNRKLSEPEPPPKELVSELEPQPEELFTDPTSISQSTPSRPKTSLVVLFLTSSDESIFS
jgi:hypothetical protein